MYFLQRKTSNNGTLNLPKKWRIQLELDCGDLVEIQLKNKEIWIKQSHEKSTNLQMYIRQNGYLTIPSEVRRLLRIKKNIDYDMYVAPEEKTFVLRPCD